MFQPLAEKEAERQIIRKFAEYIGATVEKLQNDTDDGLVDGVIKVKPKGREVLINIEARRKGFPNHKGKSCYFNKGWQTNFLVNDGGIYLNESTIRNHEKKGFIFLVEINGYKPRYCAITDARAQELLNQPVKFQKSTNSGNMQSVKTVPLSWFREYSFLAGSKAYYNK